MPGVPNRWSENFQGLKKHFSAMRGQYQRASLSAGFIPSEGLWQLFRGVLRFTRVDDPLLEAPPPESVDCGTLRFSSLSLGVDDGFRLIECSRRHSFALGLDGFQVGPFCDDSVDEFFLIESSPPLEVRGLLKWPYRNFVFHPNHFKDPPLPDRLHHAPLSLAVLNPEHAVDRWTGEGPRSLKAGVSHS